MTYNSSGHSLVWDVTPYNVTIENYCFGENITESSITVSKTVYHDCREICTTPKLLFSGPTTFQRCFYLTGNATDQSLAALSRSEDFNATLRQSVNFTNDCLLESCLGRDESRSECLSLDSAASQFGGLFGGTGHRVTQSICPAKSGGIEINAAIGGPGVSKAWPIVTTPTDFLGRSGHPIWFRYP